MGRKMKASVTSKNDKARLINSIRFIEGHGYRVITKKQLEGVKDDVTEFVMKRAYVMVLAAFLDEGNTHWQTYFKSKKKKDEFMNHCIEQIELYGKWVEQDKILHFDEIADFIYEKYGKDYRTEWQKAHERDSKLEEYVQNKRMRGV